MISRPWNIPQFGQEKDLIHIPVSMAASEELRRRLWPLVSASGLEDCSLENSLSTIKVNYCRDSGCSRIVLWEVKKKNFPDILTCQVIHLALLSAEDVFHNTQDA